MKARAGLLRSGFLIRYSVFISSAALCVAARPVLLLGAEADAVQRGTVRHEVLATEAEVAPRFRLPEHAFSYEQRPLGEVSDKLTISFVTFPSPVVTPETANNTVHCEYYRPRCEGRVPGVVVLHILGGDFPLARVFCNVLAQRGVAALFLKMPYYGPRRTPGSDRRMVSKDVRQTVAGMTQAVLDIRQAVSWLAARPEIDSRRLGVFGISLGGITAALAATAEPRLRNACLLLAGGDMGQIGWQSPELAEVRDRWTSQGGTREGFFELMQSVDPVTYARNMSARRVLMLNAQSDEVIPKECTLALWRAFGQPEIVWYEGGHYSVARHLFAALERVAVFFAQDRPPPAVLDSPP